MSFVDRSFEEVCALMDRAGDAIDLFVEHATDYRICDLFEENTLMNSGSSSGCGASSNLRKNIEDLSTGLAPGKHSRSYCHFSFLFPVLHTIFN